MLTTKSNQDRAWGSSDGVEASLSDGNVSLLNRASLLTPLNYPGGPCPQPCQLFLNTSLIGSG